MQAWMKTCIGSRFLSCYLPQAGFGENGFATADVRREHRQQLAVDPLDEQVVAVRRRRRRPRRGCPRSSATCPCAAC